MECTFRVIVPNKIIESDNDLAILRVTRLNGAVVEFLIDCADIPLVRPYRWFSHNGYCCTMKYGRHWYLTWELFGRPSKGHILHHLNGRRDNRRSQICLVPRGVNNYFKEVQENRSTGRRGVSLYSSGSIVALIGTGGKRKSFNTMEEAIAARESFENIMMEQLSPVYLAGNRVGT